MVGTDESTELGMTARLTLKFANGIDNENRKMEKFRKSPSRKCFTVLAYAECFILGKLLTAMQQQ